MTNNQAIAYIKGIILRYRKIKNKRNVLLYIEEKDIEALEYAAESLQTDEVYNLMHEHIPFVILSENATNGEVVKAVFPEATVFERSNYNYISIDDDVWLEDRNGEWVNSPYRKEK